METLEPGPETDARVARALDLRQCLRCGTWQRGEKPECAHDEAMAAGSPSAFSTDVAAAVRAASSLGAFAVIAHTEDKDWNDPEDKPPAVNGYLARVGEDAGYDEREGGWYERSMAKWSRGSTPALAICAAILAATESA